VPGVEPRVRLVIADDGVGVDPSRLDRRAEGHLGVDDACRRHTSGCGCWPTGWRAWAGSW
jgi:hypothetical protein